MNHYSKDIIIDWLQEGLKLKYLFFWGHRQKGSQVTKACFSQWFPAAFVVSGETYLTAEHYMMVHKARLFNAPAVEKAIFQSTHPGAAKQLGRTIPNFVAEVWDKHKFEIVVSGNLAKFKQNPELKAFLKSTGDRVLVEASPVDAIWGIGLDEKDPKASNPYVWKGENLLGFALMEVRDRLLGRNPSTRSGS